MNLESVLALCIMSALGPDRHRRGFGSDFTGERRACMGEETDPAT
jgi:hypothetical protein